MPKRGRDSGEQAEQVKMGRLPQLAVKKAPVGPLSRHLFRVRSDCEASGLR
jgi:hypothetical protein